MKDIRVCPVGSKKVKGNCIPSWEKVGDIWQFAKGKYDFVIEHPRGQEYILSVFKRNVKDHDKAYIFSDEFSSLSKAKEAGEKWKG